MAKFECLLLSLKRPATPPMVEAIGHDEQVPSRQEFLYQWFAELQYFDRKHSSKRHSFKPIHAPEGFIAGFFSKESRTRTRRSPVHDHEEVQQENWPVAFILIDTRPNQQVVWMQYNPEVGPPRRVLEGYFLYLRRKGLHTSFEVHIEHKIRRVYWKIVNENKHRITQISFTFLPPNALGGEEKVNDFLRDLRDEVNYDTTTHSYQGEPGSMEPEGELISASANIALEGGGHATVKAGRKTLYKSDQNRLTETVDNAAIPSPKGSQIIETIINRLIG